MNTETFLMATIPQLSSLTNISEETWRQYLYKEPTPGMQFMRKASQKLGMSLDELDRAIFKRREMIQKQREAREQINQAIAATKS